jgi:hypothetical protein
MCVQVIIASSARKHDVSDDDMLHAWRNPIEVTYHGDGFTMTIGPSRSGALLEVGSVVGADGIVIVHAMEAQPKNLPERPRQRERGKRRERGDGHDAKDS